MWNVIDLLHQVGLHKLQTNIGLSQKFDMSCFFNNIIALKDKLVNKLVNKQIVLRLHRKASLTCLFKP